MSENNDSKNIDNENIDSEKKDANENGQSQNSNDENTDSKKTVPLSTFLGLKDELKTLKGKLEELDNAKTEAERKKLEEQGEYKTLLETTKADLEGKIASLQPKADAFDELDASERAEIKENLGDKWEDEFDELSLKALRKINKRLSLPDKIDDADNGGGNRGGKELTEAEKAEAKRMDLSEDGYKRFKQKREEAKNKKENKLWPV